MCGMGLVFLYVSFEWDGFLKRDECSSSLIIGRWEDYPLFK
jgi:hypothetical protein